MGTLASQITSLLIVYSTVYSDADERKHQNFASLAFVCGIHRWPVNSPHKWPLTCKMLPFDDVIMEFKFWSSMFCGTVPYFQWRAHSSSSSYGSTDSILAIFNCIGLKHITLHNMYRKIYNIRRTKSQNLKDSLLVFQLSLRNPLKPGVKSRMRM